MAWDGHRAEDIVAHSELFRKVSEGLMNINGFVWPEESISVVSAVVRPYTGEGPAIIVDPTHTPIVRAVPAPQPANRAGNQRGLPGRLRSTNVHSEPSIVNRLIRMVEELTEREDLPDVDMRWYYNRLAEIKKELNNAEEGGSEAIRGTGECAKGQATPCSGTGNGGLLPGE